MKPTVAEGKPAWPLSHRPERRRLLPRCREQLVQKNSVSSLTFARLDRPCRKKI
jgi:hypothetical protein